MKHSKTPWTLEGNNCLKYICDTEGNGITEFVSYTGDLPEESVRDAKHIVKCVNHFEELKTFIETCADAFKSDKWDCTAILDYVDREAKQLLEKLEKE